MKRPRVLSLISSEIRNLEKASNNVASVPSSQISSSSSCNKEIYKPSLNYVSVSSFQMTHFSYADLSVVEGVDQEKMETDFKPMSFDAKFHDEIVPEKCKMLVKPTRVVITLVKASKELFKPNLDKEKDPMAGIMDLMKDPGCHCLKTLVHGDESRKLVLHMK
ncbi:hypothetical protein HAX54_023253 [Datura stramonium]|uniref:Uncharacterized protein n=1 Tax=Datura stramonium TaxID=4076 RepID=A0ABS8UYV6_DATST|nr:hypothetical protein [Datura stramonium]